MNGYHSDQHTKCALCGIDKHTPLRTWDGYICLTCIDKLLEKQRLNIELAENTIRDIDDAYEFAGGHAKMRNDTGKLCKQYWKRKTTLL